MRLIPELDDYERAHVIAVARSLLTAHKGGPVPFRHQGRTLRGLDCIGVLAYAFGSLGYPIEDRIDYGRLPADRKLAASLSDHFGQPIAKSPRMEQLRPCDVVTMSWGAEECHVALVVDHPHGVGMVHAYASSKRVIEHRIDDLVLSRIHSVFRP